jgi:hypothetical protein
VRGLLEADARRKELRRKMQDMLEEMSDDEYAKWVESFQKLHDGDEVMLVRLPPESVSIGRTAATPAPIDLQRRVRNASGVSRGTARGKAQPNTVQRSAPRNRTIKRESNAGQSIGEDIRNKADNEVAITTAALRHLPTEGPDVEPKLQTLPIAETQHAQSSELELTSASTPIVDLLWGRAPFSYDNRVQVSKVIVESIEERITELVSQALLFQILRTN